MEIHNMNEWNEELEVIMERMKAAKDVLDASLGSLILFRDNRYDTGQFGVITDGLFEQFQMPDLVLGNIPYYMFGMTEEHANLLELIATYMYARKDEITFKADMTLGIEGQEFLLKDYEGYALEIVSNQEEVPYCACCEAGEHVGE
jgi:hypothetical protein